MMTYPDFRLLPKGLKQLLLASENFFFNQAIAPPRRTNEKQSFMPNPANERRAMGSWSHPAWRN
jgi:hypothetical protein